VDLFQKNPVKYKVKTYSLNYGYVVTELKVKKYNACPAPLKFFAIRTDTGKFKSIKFGSENRQVAEELHSQIRKYTEK